MYTVTKRMEISASHKLNLDYESKCRNLHGHNWIVVVHLRNKTLNHNGMIMDFTHIKKKIHDRLDHQHINDVMTNINPTAENMAKWICDELGTQCFKVEVQESEGNVAIYERD